MEEDTLKFKCRCHAYIPGSRKEYCCAPTRFQSRRVPANYFSLGRASYLELHLKSPY